MRSRRIAQIDRHTVRVRMDLNFIHFWYITNDCVYVCVARCSAIAIIYCQWYYNDQPFIQFWWESMRGCEKELLKNQLTTPPKAYQMRETVTENYYNYYYYYYCWWRRRWWCCCWSQCKLYRHDLVVSVQLNFEWMMWTTLAMNWWPRPRTVQLSVRIFWFSIIHHHMLSASHGVWV